MNVDVIKIGMDLNSRDNGNGAVPEIKSLLHLFDNCFDKVFKQNSSFKQKGEKLLVINGLANNGLDLEKYNFINNYKGEVYYIHCDFDLILKQKINIKGRCRDITRKIKYITQADYVTGIKRSMKTDDISIVKQFTSFPFYKFPMLRQKYKKPKTKVLDNIMYYGGFRQGNRKKKLQKYFCSLSWPITIYGNITKKQLEIKNKFIDYSFRIPQRQVLTKLNNSLATLIIGDSTNNKNITQRFYETIMAGTIPIIDEDYDLNRRCIEYREDLYISDSIELYTLLKKLQNKKYRDNLLTDIKKNVIDTFKKDEYYNKFKEVVK